MYGNESAEKILDSIKEYMSMAEKERWVYYERAKRRLQDVCKWGREYEYYIKKLTRLLKL